MSTDHFGRTPEQFAIEHGRYLVDAIRSYKAAILRNPWTADDISDASRALNDAIYEFEKRANHAYPKR